MMDPKKRPATASELSGAIGPDGIVPASWKNSLSLAQPGIEPRMKVATYKPASWDGITGVCYPIMGQMNGSGQFPQVDHFKVWEDN